MRLRIPTTAPSLAGALLATLLISSLGACSDSASGPLAPDARQSPPRWFGTSTTGIPMTDLGPGMPAGISESGMVVGTISQFGKNSFGFYWTAAEGRKDVTIPDRDLAFVSVNNLGIVAGVESDPRDDSQRVFRWSKASGFAFLPTPPSWINCGANAINDRGTVVGNCFIENVNFRGVIWPGGGWPRSVGTFGAPGAPDHASLATGLAANDVAVGSTRAIEGGNGSNEIPFRFAASEGGIHHLAGFPSSDFSTPGGISPDGSTIVGHAVNFDTGFSAFGYEWKASTGMVRLVPPSGLSRPEWSPYAVNNQEWIVGGGFHPTSAPGGGFVEFALLWRPHLGWTDLGHWPGDVESVALGVMNNGRWVIGQSIECLSGCSGTRPDFFVHGVIWKVP